MTMPPPPPGDPVLDDLVRDGTLVPPSDPGGVAALLAIEPVVSERGIDSAEIVSEQRAEPLPPTAAQDQPPREVAASAALLARFDGRSDGARTQPGQTAAELAEERERRG